MKIKNNKAIAESGKFLRLCYDNQLYDSIELGKRYILINDKPTLVELTINDITEVQLINVPELGEVCVSSTTYSKLVTELIRLKYSLDDELALIANSRIKDMSQKEQDFQAWRKICKQVAKQNYE